MLEHIAEPALMDGCELFALLPDFAVDDHLALAPLKTRDTPKQCCFAAAGATENGRDTAGGKGRLGPEAKITVLTGQLDCYAHGQGRIDLNLNILV